MAKSAFKSRKNLFISNLDLNLRKKTGEMRHLEKNYLLCSDLNPSESRPEIPEKF
jgi:hypothetical protein